MSDYNAGNPWGPEPKKNPSAGQYVDGLELSRQLTVIHNGRAYGKIPGGKRPKFAPKGGVRVIPKVPLASKQPGNYGFMQRPKFAKSPPAGAPKSLANGGGTTYVTFPHTGPATKTVNNLRRAFSDPGSPRKHAGKSAPPAPRSHSNHASPESWAPTSIVNSAPNLPRYDKLEAIAPLNPNNPFLEPNKEQPAVNVPEWKEIQLSKTYHESISKERAEEVLTWLEYPTATFLVCREKRKSDSRQDQYRISAYISPKVFHHLRFSVQKDEFVHCQNGIDIRVHQFSDFIHALEKAYSWPGPGKAIHTCEAFQSKRLLSLHGGYKGKLSPSEVKAAFSADSRQNAYLICQLPRANGIYTLHFAQGNNPINFTICEDGFKATDPGVDVIESSIESFVERSAAICCPSRASGSLQPVRLERRRSKSRLRGSSSGRKHHGKAGSKSRESSSAESSGSSSRRKKRHQSHKKNS